MAITLLDSAPTQAPVNNNHRQRQSRRIPAPPQAEPVTSGGGASGGFVKQRDELAQDLMLVRMIVRCPTWRLATKDDTQIISRDNNGGYTQVEGSTTRPCLKLDLGEIFDKINKNSRKLDLALASFTVLDSEDSFRLISVFNKEEFLARVAQLHEDRMAIAREFDQGYDQWVASLREHHKTHFWQIEGRLPVPPFKDKLDVQFSLRPLSVVTPDQLDFSKLSPQAQQTLVSKMQSDAEAMVKNRMNAIVNGAMKPILDMAQEINGQLPNSRFDPSKPEDKENRRFLPGIDSGKKKSGFLDNLVACLERVSNFRQYMSPQVLAQVDQTMEAVKKANGSVSKINADKTIQDAINSQMQTLGQVMRHHAREFNTAGRDARTTLI